MVRDVVMLRERLFHFMGPLTFLSKLKDARQDLPFSNRWMQVFSSAIFYRCDFTKDFRKKVLLAPDSKQVLGLIQPIREFPYFLRGRRSSSEVEGTKKTQVPNSATVKIKRTPLRRIV